MTDKEILIMMTTKCADLERKLAERNRAHIEIHQDYNKKYNECEDLERQLEEAREENAELLIKLKAYKEEALKVSKNLRFKMLD